MFPAQNVYLNSSRFNGVKILTVDNDRDSGALYTALFESYNAKVITTESIKEALSLLNRFSPDILICEARFFGESVDSLIQYMRPITLNIDKVIPIFVTSTCPAKNLGEQLKYKVEAYQIKPIDLDQFVATVWNLILPSKITQTFTVHI